MATDAANRGSPLQVGLFQLIGLFQLTQRAESGNWCVADCMSNSTQLSLNGSSLIRLLSELTTSAAEHSFTGFGSRFGQLFALTDSLKLAEMHRGLAKTDFEPRDMEQTAIEAEFLRVQKKIVDSLSRRFIADDSDGVMRNLFPGLRAEASAAQLASYESYHGFYVNLQREIDREVQYLQSFTRDAVSGLSPELAQLVIIDSTLGDALAVHSRKLFALVPQLLGQRFEFLLQQHHQSLFNPEQDDVSSWTKTGGWLDRFRLDMHELALAELDVRLQTVLGLIEAINEH